ncbi:hypothetical protein [Corynebacterium matruchotii]|uniref:YobI family P-loop NTPase n=1 Tax=Corynebacterium matruchotii TaxID=43768 RepID=UPI0028E1A9EB|nr:hypothetical protein [Corynebacterium matruchotii]
MSTDPDSQQEASDPEASKQPDQGDKSIDKKADGVVDLPVQEEQSSDASTDPDSPQEVSNPEASKQPNQDGKSVDKKADVVADPPAQEKQNPNASSELIVLSPHYDEIHHGLYVEKLEQAVRNPKVRNIALTGGYGTGKSSIIQGLVERIHSSKELKKIRPITISLPTIQIADESDSGDNRTDRIQREIVKQLLYRSNPRKMRGSQYRRITHVTVAQRATICFIVAAFLTFTFWSLAKPDWHWHWSQGGSLRGYWQPAVVQVISWGLTFYIDWIWVDKPTLKGLELGPTKLELDKNDSNYFDKYLNEIIYYFEVSGTNLVIFEDLDRFDNPYIFDALHELNELINISLGQERFTEQRNPSVKFLYTTRDSIFEHKTEGVIENDVTRHIHRREVENRTKFFDVIVPIVPFSTSRNAYEYLKQLLNSSTFPIEIDRTLLEIIGSEISDYRLLANIVSEFQTFARQIFNSWGNNKETADFLEDHANYLFAFIVYKNTHLTDYEKIRIGESKLDELYIRFIKMRIDVHKIIKEILEKLGHNLKKRINSKTKADFRRHYILINNEWFLDCSRLELWKKALNYNSLFGKFPNTADIAIFDPTTNNIDYFGYDIFVDTIKEELSSREPSIENINDLDPRRIINSINSLRKVDNIYHLFQCKTLVLPGDIQEKVEAFKKFIGELFNNDRMTRELLKSNYINGNFYAYNSVFIEGFSNIKIFNFLTKNVGAGQPNINLRLSKQEAQEIAYQLRKNNNLHTTLKGALNADLLLHLSSETWDTPDFILDDVKHLFRSESILEFGNISEYYSQDNRTRIELVNTILERWLSDRQKADYNILKSYNDTKRLLEKIIPLYPDIFLECFDDLAKVHKCMLIASALNTSHLRTTINIKRYIKENIGDILLFIKSFDRMSHTDKDIKNRIDNSLGLNPLITHRHKETMKRMLERKTLRNISEEEINTLKHLNDAPKETEFHDLEKDSWIPLQNVTEYELETIEVAIIFPET